MSSVEEVSAAVVAAQSTGLPVMVTMTFDTAGRTMMGIQPQEFAKLAKEQALAGFGANCGIGPAELLDSVFGMIEANDNSHLVPLIAKGNCGIPSYVEGEIHYEGTPELMADYARLAYLAGARIIGGCCGTTSAHIAAMKGALDALVMRPQQDPITRDDAAKILGTPWANVPTPPASSDNGCKRRRRRG